MKTEKTRRTERCSARRVPKRPPRVPNLRHHKASGQGYVVLNGKPIYLGRYDQPETTQRYHRVIAEWIADGRQLPLEAEEITVKEVLARFLLHARDYYVRPDGTPTGEVDNFHGAMKPLKRLYAETPAHEFGPKALRVVRQQMLDAGWCRTNVNQMVGRIKRLFRWAAAHELVPGNVWHSLQAVAGLRRGRCGARESEPVRPVPRELIDGIEPFVSRQVWAMIQLQLLTAARPGEIAIMRPCDVDRSDKMWLYRPAEHKTAYRDHERTIYIGPRAQQVLAPFLLRSSEAHCFSPAEALAEYYTKKHAERTTPPHYGNRPGTNRVRKPQRCPGDRYTVTTYRRAILRACDQAFPPPGEMTRRPDELVKEWRARLEEQHAQPFRAWRKAHRWHPHQLRHNAATELRREFGLEAARIILGHRSAAVTILYAEADLRKAMDVIMKVG